MSNNIFLWLLGVAGGTAAGCFALSPRAVERLAAHLLAYATGVRAFRSLYRHSLKDFTHTLVQDNDSEKLDLEGDLTSRDIVTLEDVNALWERHAKKTAGGMEPAN